MKEVKAVMRQSKFYVVKAALDSAGIKGLTVYDVRGQGNQKGNTVSRGLPGSFRASDTVPKTRIEIICSDDEVKNITSIIKTAAYTGEKGDGIISISDVIDVIRIRSDEHKDQGLV